MARHYVLPILPFVIMLAVHAWRTAADRVSPQRSIVLNTLSIAACAMVIGKQTIRARNEWYQLRYRVEDTNVLRLAQFLPSVASNDSSIVFDYGMYVPPQFVNAKPTWRGSLRMLGSIDPTLCW